MARILPRRPYAILIVDESREPAARLAGMLRALLKR
jgi:hypothetical protein